MLIPLTVPETRRLLGESSDAAAQQHRLHWSQWRRRHQATAKRGHVTRRKVNIPSVRGLLTAIPIPGTPPLTEGLWARLAPLLPSPCGKRGRAPGNSRCVLDGLLWMMHTGVGWRGIPSRFGGWHTVYSRYQQWCRDGTWERIVAMMTLPVNDC